ncbi:MAG: NAD-dependent epimerase/dehydratase family protein [Phycisphaerales bacterium]|nr:NAD-dependent epimerase/dehydratase family protein [Phycisphaerales bacterium]
MQGQTQHLNKFDKPSVILVTGGSGFLGTELIKQLLQGDLTSVGMIRALYHKRRIPEMQHPKLEWIYADIRDLADIKAVFIGVTHVYHTAAFVSLTENNYEKMYDTNVKGTKHIVDMSLQHKIQKLVFVSSVATLDTTSIDNEPLSEGQTTTRPKLIRGIYAETKYLAELEVWRGVAEGLSVVVVNPSVIIGYSNKAPDLSMNLLKKHFFYPAGASGFIMVQDVAKALIMLMNSIIQNERFILNAQNLTYQELFSIANKKGTTSMKPVPNFLLFTIAVIGTIISKIKRRPPLITIELAHTLQKKMCYTATKFLNQFPDFLFLNVSEEIEKRVR